MRNNSSWFSVLALWLAGLVCVAPALGQANNRPSAPVINEPVVDGMIINPEDVHMETGPFADLDPFDVHVCTDWEIWLVSPSERIWAALCVTGPEKLHAHLGDGVFQGSHAGRSSLLPQRPYTLRVRHKDSSGNPLTQWSEWSTRTFTTGELSRIFALEVDDIASTPAPVWVDVMGAPVEPLGLGVPPPALRLESAGGELLLEITGTGTLDNEVFNPDPLSHHAPVRVRMSAGGGAISLAETDLRFTDGAGVDRTIFLPAAGLGPGETALFWVASNGSTYLAQPEQTSPEFSTLARGAPVPWTVQPGFKVEVVATGFQLPVNIAFLPHPGPEPDAPLFYVAELYGAIKVVRRDGTVGVFASNLLNFNPTGNFPGSGELGLAGIVVHPGTGEVYATLLYNALPPNGPLYPRVIRFHSTDGGRTATSHSIVLDLVGETQAQSHQISKVSFGPDGKLYVHVGDGFAYPTALNLNSFRGKILRVNPNGSAPADNPLYTGAGGARDWIYAYGLRNPFGGDWRSADGRLYLVGNGPSVDRLAQVLPGRNFGWDGTDASMYTHAAYNWSPSTAPVNIAFIQPQTFGGSAFPSGKMGHGFVTESGPTWATGPQANGKRITEFVFDAAGNVISGPTPLVHYNGSGKATVAGLAAGPDGLYFTDLFKDQGWVTPIDPGANVLRVRFVGAADFSADVTMGGAPLTVQFTDQSNVPSPTAWLWSFGDGTTSTEQNPVHVYNDEGAYNVRLTVTGPNGAAIAQRNGYVRVGAIPRLALIGGSIPATAADLAVAEHLRGKGFTVDLFPDLPGSRPTAQEFAADYDLVLVSSTILGANVGGEFRAQPVPLLFWEQALLRTEREALMDNGTIVPGATTIDIVDSGHPITQGLASGSPAVFQPGAVMSVGLGTVAPGASVLARRGGSTDAAIIVAEQGAALLEGYIAPARRTFLFLENTSFLNATAAARDILERAVCWTGGFHPQVTAQPISTAVQQGGTVVLTAAANGGGPLHYQWKHDGDPVAAEGPGGRITGARTSILTITNAQLDDAGSYEVVVTNLCGTQTSLAAVVTVIESTCPADHNGDGMVNSQDIAAFIADWLMSISDGTLTADFNTDGVVNSTDISAFISVWLDTVITGC